MKEYIVQSGDTLSLIAKKLYGQEKFWPFIFDYNMSTIDNTHQIVPGMLLYIPNPIKVYQKMN
jgi:nucleoid-associated protein YgaU